MASAAQLGLQTLAGGCALSREEVPPGIVIDSAPATSSSPSMEKIVPRRRFQKGRVYKRGGKWVGSYRDYEINPSTSKRTRRTITFDESVISERAAYAALQRLYLDDYNAKAKNNAKPSPPKGGKTVSALVREWTDKILPLRKPAGSRASLSHIRAYILPQLGLIPLNEMTLTNTKPS